jgi:hypothetical protein
VSPGRFLAGTGPVLVVLGVLGATGQLGSVSPASVFHPLGWINWFHLGLGLVVIAVGLFGPPGLQSATALAAAVVGTTVGLAGLLLGPWAATRYGVPELADPSDHLAHLSVGLLAWWGWGGRCRAVERCRTGAA